MSQSKQQENREKGESRTLTVIADGFWVLKRNIDIDGADFLVQLPASSDEELRDRHKRIEVLGIVQAKYFENSNQVKIAKLYVEDDIGPRTEFFAFLHTNNEEGENVCYFFSAKQIIENFYLDKEGKYFCFSLTKERRYEEFRNICKNEILKRIKNGIQITQEKRNNEFIRVIYILVEIDQPNLKIVNTMSSRYELIQNEKFFEISKIDKSTGTKSSLGKHYGNLENFEFDPITETLKVKTT